MRLTKNKLIIIVSLIISTMTLFAEADKKYKLLPLQSIKFSTVRQICEPMLSSGGKLVYEKSRNSVLVYDTPEIIAKIEHFIASADRPPVNIRIELQRQSTSPGRDVYIGETPRKTSRYSNKYPAKIIINDGKANIHFNNKIINNKNHQDFQVRDRSSIVNRNVSSFIMTSSGEPASLWVGTSMVDPSWLRNSQRHPKVIIVNGSAPTVVEAPPDDIKYTDVGVSLQVLPTCSDNGMINVQIYPEISYLVGGKKKNVRVESLMTQVTVRSGQRVFIGGVMAAKSTQYRELFGRNFFTRSDVAEVMNMYLTATASTPGSSGRGSSITNDWIPRGR